jgi:hypothetical protein
MGGALEKERADPAMVWKANAAIVADFQPNPPVSG